MNILKNKAINVLNILENKVFKVLNILQNSQSIEYIRK